MILNTEHSSAEQNENAAWRTMSIAWDADEHFALSLVPGEVGMQLLAWNAKAQWVSPLLPAWNGSLNFATDK